MNNLLIIIVTIIMSILMDICVADVNDGSKESNLTVQFYCQGDIDLSNPFKCLVAIKTASKDCAKVADSVLVEWQHENHSTTQPDPQANHGQTLQPVLYIDGKRTGPQPRLWVWSSVDQPAKPVDVVQKNPLYIETVIDPTSFEPGIYKFQVVLVNGTSVVAKSDEVSVSVDTTKSTDNALPDLNSLVGNGTTRP